MEGAVERLLGMVLGETSVAEDGSHFHVWWDVV